MAEYCARIRISEDVCTEIGPEIIVTNKMCAWMWHSEHSSLAPFVGCLLTTLLKDSIIDSFIKTFHICPIIIFFGFPLDYWTLRKRGVEDMTWEHTALRKHNFEETQLWRNMTLRTTRLWGNTALRLQFQWHLSSKLHFLNVVLCVLNVALSFLATLVALHFTLVSKWVSGWAEFRTSVASRLASLLFWVELFLFDHVELVKVSFLIP